MFVRAYLRASTEEQDAHRARDELKAFAADRGLSIAAWYVRLDQIDKLSLRLAIIMGIYALMLLLTWFAHRPFSSRDFSAAGRTAGLQIMREMGRPKTDKYNWACG